LEPLLGNKKTVSDKIKYGEALDDMPDELVGLTDQNAQLSERATILRRKENNDRQNHTCCRLQRNDGMGEGGGIAQRGTFAECGMKFWQ